MTIDLPELATVDLDGLVRYRAWEGPAEATFVLIHGLGGSHLNWLQVAPGLAGLGRVLALDLPGFGRSPRDGRGSGLMDERRVVSRFVEELATGRVVLVGHSMGGVIAILQAAVDRASTAGLVLTSSALPWARGSFPHPAVMGAFALYDTPFVGDRFARVRMRGMDPEQVVRFGFRLIAADPSSIPDEIVRLNVDLVRERQGDPDAPDAFLDAARSMLRLGKRADVSERAIARHPVSRPPAARPAGPIRTRGVRGGRAGQTPDVARSHLPRSGPCSADGGPRSMAGRGRRLVRRDRLTS